MYFVKYGNEYLHDPRTVNRYIIEASVSGGENNLSYFDFTLPTSHDLYNRVTEKDMYNLIEVYDDDTYLFGGYIYEISKDFNLSKSIRCVDILSLLKFSVIRPYSTESNTFGLQAPNILPRYFEWLIEQHNAQVPDPLRFYIGINECEKFVSKKVVLTDVDYYSTYDLIFRNIIDMYAGRIRSYRKNGKNYIDILYEWVEANSQILDFGVNLTSYSQIDSSETTANAVIPLGAPMSETLYEYDKGYRKITDTTWDKNKHYYILNQYEEWYYQYEETAEEEFQEWKDKLYVESGGNYTKTTDQTYNKDHAYYYYHESYREYTIESTTDFNNMKSKLYDYNEYFDQSSMPLTITDMPDSGIANYENTIGASFFKRGDAIYYNHTDSSKGSYFSVYQNSEITTREELMAAGFLDLAGRISPIRTIEIRAVDMHLINNKFKPIKIGDYVRVRSKPHGFDSFMLCTNISLDLNSPQSSEYVLTTSYDAMTGESNKRINELNRGIN